MDETTLVAQAQSGDTAAFAALVGQHATRAYRIAYVITGSHHDAEDAVQEACLTAYRALGSLRDGTSFAAWFGRIAANRARDVVRQQHGRRLRDEAAAAQAEPVATDPDTDTANDLTSAIEALPQPHREVVMLYYAGDLTAGEVATMLQRPPGTVRRLLSEAYTRLRQYLKG